METQSIEIQARTGTGKSAVRKLRAEGMIPGVCYGNGVEPFNIALSADELDKVLFSTKGRNTVLTVQLDGTTHTVMLSELQRDPLKRTPRHVDFRTVSADDQIVLEVPVKTTGNSVGVKAGGRLNPVRRTVAVHCKVADIPPAIVYDVTNLAMGENVLASDLVAPENCRIEFKSDFVVLQVAAPRSAEEVSAGDEEEVEEAEVAAE